MKLQSRKLASQARDARMILGYIHDHAEHIARRANDDSDDGRKGTNYDAVRRGGQELTGPEAFAARPYGDMIAEDAAHLARAMAEIHRLTIQVRLWAGRIERSQHDRDLAASRALGRNDQGRVYGPGEGHCSNCDVYVPGTPSNRLRSLRCNPCRVYWDRHKTERPRELWDGNAA